MLLNTPNQPSKLKFKKWVKINDESRETYNENNEIRFETSLLTSSICDYSDLYILVKGTTTVEKETEAAPNNTNKKVPFKNCAPFSKCIPKIDEATIDDAEDLDLVMSMYSVIEHRLNYSKTTGSL